MFRRKKWYFSPHTALGSFNIQKYYKGGKKLVLILSVAYLHREYSAHAAAARETPTFNFFRDVKMYFEIEKLRIFSSKPKKRTGQIKQFVFPYHLPL